MPERRKIKRTSRFVTHQLQRRRNWLAAALAGKAKGCPKCDGPCAATYRSIKAEQAFVCLLCLNKFTRKAKNV
jgi:transposase-like protein